MAWVENPQNSYLKHWDKGKTWGDEYRPDVKRNPAKKEKSEDRMDEKEEEVSRSERNLDLTDDSRPFEILFLRSPPSDRNGPGSFEESLLQCLVVSTALLWLTE